VRADRSREPLESTTGTNETVEIEEPPVIQEEPVEHSGSQDRAEKEEHHASKEGSLFA
jgi:hypothetical protein